MKTKRLWNRSKGPSTHSLWDDWNRDGISVFTWSTYIVPRFLVSGDLLNRSKQFRYLWRKHLPDPCRIQLESCLFLWDILFSKGEIQKHTVPFSTVSQSCLCTGPWFPWINRSSSKSEFTLGYSFLSSPKFCCKTLFSTICYRVSCSYTLTGIPLPLIFIKHFTYFS